MTGLDLRVAQRQRFGFMYHMPFLLCFANGNEPDMALRRNAVFGCCEEIIVNNSFETTRKLDRKFCQC